MASKLDDVEKLEVTGRKQWRDWLKKNHERKEGVWLITWKKGTPSKHLRYAETVEEALCFGWIDSAPRKLDELRRMLYFCPRRPKSVWSRSNKERVERLIEEGLMMPAGLAAIALAKANGSWSALDAAEAMEMPEELLMAFRKNKVAQRNFDAFPPGSRKIILQWIHSARTDVTRSKRINETVELAARNLRANQPPK